MSCVPTVEEIEAWPKLRPPKNHVVHCMTCQASTIHKNSALGLYGCASCGETNTAVALCARNVPYPCDLGCPDCPGKS